jgi:uncharacterized RDD family membrane protein YckC
MNPAPGLAIMYCAECGRPSAPDDLAHFGTTLICGWCKDTYAQKLREGVAPHSGMIYASFWNRVGAMLIDSTILATVGGAVQSTIMGPFFTIPRVQPGAPPSMEALGSLFGVLGLVSLLNMAIAAAYEGVFVGKMAATPCKMAVGLRVVRADGSAVTITRGFGRYFAKFISSMTMLIGYIMVAFDAERRGLHDMICDTRVILVRR